jgi:hypothetical protein
MSSTHALPADGAASTTCPVRRCHEHESGDGFAGLSGSPKPRPHRRAAHRVGGCHHSVVAVDMAPLRGEVGQDQESRSHSRLPPESVGRDASCKADFLVVLAQRRLDGHHLGLDLHDKKRSCRLVPGEQIDGAPLAIHRIRHLSSRGPPRRFEELGDTPDERRVAFVHEALQVPATPPKGDNDFCVERTGDGANPPEWHVVDAPAFDPRHDVLRLTAVRRQVILCPGSAMAEPADATSDSHVVHRARIARRAYSVLIRSSSRARRHWSPRFSRATRGAGVRG